MIRHGIGRVEEIVGVFALGSAAPSAARPAAVSVSVPVANAVERVVASAEAQVGRTVNYDPVYVRLRYPGGDIPLDRGVCSDVIVRALRGAGLDLQMAVHEDMARNFAAYPRKWNLRRPDPIIGHYRLA